MFYFFNLKFLKMAKHLKVTVTSGKSIEIETSQDEGVTYSPQEIINRDSIVDIQAVYPINNPQKNPAGGYINRNSGFIVISKTDKRETRIKLSDVISPSSWSNTDGDSTDVKDAFAAIKVVLA